MSNDWTSLRDLLDQFDRTRNAVVQAFQGRSAQLPMANFIPVIGANDLTVTFTDASTTPIGTIVSWLWSFGDGATSVSQNPSHVYAASGSYLVTLTVENTAGLVAEAHQILTASIPELVSDNPTAKFTSSAAGLQVTFTDQSTAVAPATVTGWTWLFGDEVTANFSTSISGLQVTFTDTSAAVAPNTISTRAWSFGDGGTSAATNPVHTFSAAGAYNVGLTVTDSAGNSDTKAATVTVGSGTLGIPFGPFGLFASWTGAPRTTNAGFTAAQEYTNAGGIISEIANMRSRGYKAILMTTDDAHSTYVSNGQFDINKWRAAMDTYNTPAITAAVKTAVADGTLLGISMLDEPNHSSWGGNITKATLDSMATYAKSIFTTVAAGVLVIHTWRPTERFHNVDFTISQYDSYRGSAASFRDAALAQAALDGTAKVFSMNLLAGGSQVAGCPIPQTGGPYDLSVPLCAMTPSQVSSFGMTLAPAGSAFVMWTQSASFMANASNVSSFLSIAADLATRPRKTFYRTS